MSKINRIKIKAKAKLKTNNLLKYIKSLRVYLNNRSRKINNSSKMWLKLYSKATINKRNKSKVT